MTGPRGRWRPIALIAGIVAILVLAKALGLDRRLGDLKAWIESLGPWGPAAFVLVYIAATVAAIPGSALTVAAGALFGSAVGVATVSIGSTAGAALCFLAARHFARDAAARWAASKPTFRRLDALTERHGAIIVALTRLVPLFPFNLLNYGFGLTRIRFTTYLFWSWLCMLPGTALYVVGTDAVLKALSEGRVPWTLAAVLLAVVALLLVVVRGARRRLRAGEGGGSHA